jgi:hypothetical protein
MAKDYVEVQTPPEAFGIVEHGIYRCEQNAYRKSPKPHNEVMEKWQPRSNIPYAVNFPFLRQLGLKTVVVLSPERPVREITDFFEEIDVEMVCRWT